MNICVIGTGYVGLVTGACFAEFGVQVVCADTDGEKIAALQRGEIPIYEPGLEDLVVRNLREGGLSFTTDTGKAVRGALVLFIAVQLIVMFLQISIGAVYTTWLLGRYGATVGKMACRLKVVTADGNKISYLRALGRHFAEWISGMILLVGYIMAAFDGQKRALHDHICNTRVIRA